MSWTEDQVKAFAHPFLEGKDAVLDLMATCYYENNEFTICVEESESHRFRMMEQPPTGVFLYLFAYYAASGPPPTRVSAERPVPSYAAIIDAYGVNRVPVQRWQ